MVKWSSGSLVDYGWLCDLEAGFVMEKFQYSGYELYEVHGVAG